MNDYNSDDERGGPPDNGFRYMFLERKPKKSFYERHKVGIFFLAIVLILLAGMMIDGGACGPRIR